MTDDPQHWFAWQMDKVVIQVKVCNGATLRYYQIKRSEIGIFDTMWTQLVVKGYVEVGYQVQEEAT